MLNAAMRWRKPFNLLDRVAGRGMDRLMRGNRSFCEYTLDDHIRRYGPDDRRTLIIRWRYARALHEMHDTEAAAEQLAIAVAALERQALERQALERQVGEDDPMLWRLRLWHGIYLCFLNRFEEAEAILGPASAAGYGVPMVVEQEVLRAREDYAYVLYRLDRLTEAEAELAHVVDRLTCTRGPEDTATLRARMFYAEFLRMLGRGDESAAEYRALTEAHERARQPDTRDTLHVRERYAVALYYDGHYREAETEFAELVRRCLVTYGAEDEHTGRAQRWLAAARNAE